MSEGAADYARHFKEGARVRVGVPLAGGGKFQEWGVVHSLEDDLLQLELSRDFLPLQATLSVGGIVDLSLFDREGARHCRSMVAGELREHGLLLRLVEGGTRHEPRQFFRQDVYLALEYRLPPSQSLQEARERWRQRLWAQEFAAQSPDQDEAGGLDAVRKEIRGRLEQKKKAPPLAANLSGGGVRLNIPERLRPGMLIELTLYLPEPQRVLELVGEVVQVRPLPDGSRFSTALSFRFIEEADRDRLIGYISSRQLAQLAQQAPRWPAPRPLQAPGRWRRLRLALLLALLTALVVLQICAIVARRKSGEKHEIQRIFDDALATYLKQRR